MCTLRRQTPLGPRSDRRIEVKEQQTEANENAVQKEDGSIAARAVIARMGKAELRTDAMKITHRHLIPVARKGHYMMMVPHV